MIEALKLGSTNPVDRLQASKTSQQNGCRVGMVHIVRRARRVRKPAREMSETVHFPGELLLRADKGRSRAGGENNRTSVRIMVRRRLQRQKRRRQEPDIWTLQCSLGQFGRPRLLRQA